MSEISKETILRFGPLSAESDNEPAATEPSVGRGPKSFALLRPLQRSAPSNAVVTLQHPDSPGLQPGVLLDRGSKELRDSRRTAISARYISLLLSAICTMFFFSYLSYLYSGTFLFGTYKSQAATVSYKFHALFSLAVLIVIVFQAGMGMLATRHTHSNVFRIVHKRSGLIVGSLVVAMCLSAVVLAVYWNVKAPIAEYRTFHATYALLAVGIAALVYVPLAINHARSGRVWYHIRDIAFIVTLLFSVVVSRLVGIVLRSLGWDPAVDQFTPFVGLLGNGLQLGEVQVLITAVLVLLTWGFYASSTRILFSDWPKTLILSSVILLTPLAFAT